ncbi:run domain Beclin-1-interacting and cysteine-rich domain-containing protein isoform 2-T2 [Synchiropus picturatus]
MESVAEEDAEERRREHWKLLSSLKTTVEGLLSTNNPNVWSRYGGLQRLHKDMNNILSHGLKNEQVYYKQRDYWPFVWCVRYISPHLASHVEQFRHLEPVLSSGMQSAGESYKAERWLLQSLQVHMLSAQLRPLLKHLSNTRKYYNDDAFLLSEPHVTAMFQCLEAVEQNNAKLLAQVDTVGLSPLKGPPCLGLLKTQSLCVLPVSNMAFRSADSAMKKESLNRRFTTSNVSLQEAASPNSEKSTPLGSHNGNGVSTSPPSGEGAPWVCVSNSSENKQPLGPLSVPCIQLPEATPEAGDCVDGECDDGPEYLAIGNLGQRSRCPSQSSTLSSDQGDPKGRSIHQNFLAPPLPRRSSCSEVQNGPGRRPRGHTRSFSDTNVNQKLRNESAGSDCCIKDYSPFSHQQSDSSTSSSLYMESSGPQGRSHSDGMFRKPSEGQSLISYLSEQDFGSCADLEKENAHFNISESLIAAIELMKYNLRKQQEEGEEEGDSDCEIQQLKQKIRLRRQQIRRSRLPSFPANQHMYHSTDSGGSRRSSQDSYQGLSDSGSAEEVEECELQDGCGGASMLAVSRNGLSLSLASLFSDADIKRSAGSSSRSFLSSESITPSFLQSNSAESVAMGLLRQFEGMQLPAASELDWLVPEHDAPQKLLPIPDSLPISPDDGEHADIYKLRIRVRGNLEWAPPRPQIIFNIHPPPKRKMVVAKQNYRCAGCGTRVDPDYIKRLRYCEYIGRYFCQCCHENSQVVVPGRVLMKWDFSKYYVSNFARDLLSKIAGDPLFNPNDINSGLYKKIKSLESIRVLRRQLFHMKNLFRTCRFAKEVLDQFDTLPGHLTDDLHLYSLNDLTAVRNGDLAPRMKELLKLGTVHVASCVLCQAKGFVCEFCGNDKDIIFPFQLSKCQRCEGEPSLLMAGLAGSRAPSRRPSLTLTWKDWKIPRSRNLARALSQDRREGEGGEDVELIWRQEEEEEDEATVMEERLSKRFKSFCRWADEGEVNSENEREVGKVEGSMGEHSGEEYSSSEGRDTSSAKPDKLDLLKVLHIERLKSILKHERTSESETCSSRESLDETDEGPNRKGRRMSAFASLGKGFLKRHQAEWVKTDAKTDDKKDECETPLLEERRQEEEVAKQESDQDRFAVMKVLKQKLSAVSLSREDEGCGEVEGGSSEEEESKAKTNWRARKTRKAMRLSRGRQWREPKTEGGEVKEAAQ